MPKITDKPLARICVRIFQDDYDALARIATSDVKRNELIRRIIHSFVVHNESRVRAKIDSLTTPTPLSVNLEDL